MSDDLRQITRLNGEISKKLGTLKRSIEASNESLLSDEEKNRLKKMAQQEKILKRQNPDSIKTRYKEV